MAEPDWLHADEQDSDAAKPVIPAATVVVVRDTDDGLQTLMLRRNSKIAFGGMWVFPGGRIDPEDHDGTNDIEAVARRAAVREAVEEAGQIIDADSLVAFSHWTPPPIAPKRFATWFFLARNAGDIVTIDNGEIHDSDWMSPASALVRRDGGDIELAPPTWVTLHYLAHFDDVSGALDGFGRVETRYYETHMGRLGKVPVAMWTGDAGYDDGDPDKPGPRHRLLLHRDGYRFDDSADPFLT